MQSQRENLRTTGVENTPLGGQQYDYPLTSMGEKVSNTQKEAVGPIKIDRMNAHIEETNLKIHTNIFQ